MLVYLRVVPENPGEIINLSIPQKDFENVA